MKQWFTYGIGSCMVLLFACSTPKEIFVTKEFEENNRSSSIEMRYFKDNKIHFLDYRAYLDTVITERRNDSLLNFGLIFRRHSTTQYDREYELLFGNDSIQCNIHYTCRLKYNIEEPPVFNLFSKDPYYQDQEKQQNLALAEATGTIQYPGFKSTMLFTYKNHSGVLLMGTDSFELKPIYQGGWKPMQTLIGVQLVKGNTVYGVIHSFTGLFHKKVYLYTKASTAEQMITAAYFAVIVRFLQ